MKKNEKLCCFTQLADKLAFNKPLHLQGSVRKVRHATNLGISRPPLSPFLQEGIFFVVLAITNR